MSLSEKRNQTVSEVSTPVEMLVWECWECGRLFAMHGANAHIVRKIWRRAWDLYDTGMKPFSHALEVASGKQGVKLRVVEQKYCGC